RRPSFRPRPCLRSTVGVERAGRIGPTTQVVPPALPILAGEPEEDRLCTRLAACANVQLAQNRRDVVVDRLLGENEPLGDLGIAEPLRDEPKYFELTRGQVGRILLRRRPRPPWKRACPALPQAARDDRRRRLRP